MYGRFVGRLRAALAAALIGAVALEPESRALDVGCGPGGLDRCARRVSSAHENVAAVDSVRAVRLGLQSAAAGRRRSSRGRGGAPVRGRPFDAAFAQLVVNFMTDAERGVAEMKRVVKPGGSVAACTWDYRDGMTMLRAYWEAAHEVAPDESAEFDEGEEHALCDARGADRALAGGRPGRGGGR